MTKTKFKTRAMKKKVGVTCKSTSKRTRQYTKKSEGLTFGYMDHVWSFNS